VRCGIGLLEGQRLSLADYVRGLGAWGPQTGRPRRRRGLMLSTRHRLNSEGKQSSTAKLSALPAIPRRTTPTTPCMI
jgi:hypothetical protein